MSLLKRFQRPLITFGIYFLLLFCGAILLEVNDGAFEAMGASTLSLAAAVFIYHPLRWVVRKLLAKRKLGSWLPAETWLLTLGISLVLLVGAAESTPSHPLLTLVFLELAVFLPLIRYKGFQKQENRTRKSILGEWGSPKFLLWAITIAATAMLFVLTLYEYEPLVNFFATFYFIFLFGLSVRWLIRQIRYIINLRNEKAKTELLHLKSQVNPHFFFNMLNNLYGIVEHEPEKAQSLILKLSDLMRYSIYEGQKQEVSLREEIDYLHNFIALHRMRYHKTIEVSFVEDIETDDQQIMPLLFIILLENAFKHGVENLRQNAYVNVEITSTGKRVDFQVKNNYDPDILPGEPGIGLKNLQRRLELVYPDRHYYSFLKSGDVYTAKLSIQLK